MFEYCTVNKYSLVPASYFRGWSRREPIPRSSVLGRGSPKRDVTRKIRLDVRLCVRTREVKCKQDSRLGQIDERNGGKGRVLINFPRSKEAVRKLWTVSDMTHTESVTKSCTRKLRVIWVESRKCVHTKVVLVTRAEWRHRKESSKGGTFLMRDGVDSLSVGWVGNSVTNLKRRRNFGRDQ